MTKHANQYTLAPDARHCPLCGRENRCAVTSGDDPSSCWCQAPEIVFTEAMKAAVPSHLQRRACLCADCISALAARVE